MGRNKDAHAPMTLTVSSQLDGIQEDHPLSAASAPQALWYASIRQDLRCSTSKNSFLMPQHHPKAMTIIAASGLLSMIAVAGCSDSEHPQEFSDNQTYPPLPKPLRGLCLHVPCKPHHNYQYLPSKVSMPGRLRSQRRLVAALLRDDCRLSVQGLCQSNPILNALSRDIRSIRAQQNIVTHSTLPCLTGKRILERYTSRVWPDPDQGRQGPSATTRVPWLSASPRRITGAAHRFALFANRYQSSLDFLKQTEGMMIDQRTVPYAALLLRIALSMLALAHAGLKMRFFGTGFVKYFAGLGCRNGLLRSSSLRDTRRRWP